MTDIAVPAGHHALAVAMHPSGRGFLSLSFDEEADGQRLVAIATDETGIEGGPQPTRAFNTIVAW